MHDKDSGQWIWMDGEFLPFEQASVHVLTHTLHYGLGVFEGLRVYRTAAGPAIFRLEDHTDRLLDSAHILGIEIPFSREALMHAQVDLVRRCGLEAGYVRPLVFLGDEKRGLDPAGARTHVAISCWPWGAYLGSDAASRGIRVKVSSFARHHVNVQMCRSKSVSTYANSILAGREVRADGYDEALLLDTDGFVAEGAAENLFIVKRGVLMEPDVTSGLDGITRRTIIELARAEGWEVRAKRMTRDEVYVADEAFFTGTAAEVTPIVEVDRRRIGTGTPGPVTQRLQQRYRECVTGERLLQPHWLTHVNPA